LVFIPYVEKMHGTKSLKFIDSVDLLRFFFLS